VTNLKSNKKFRIASIEKDIIPSEGRERAYQKALKFVQAVDDSVSFRAEAKKEGLHIQEVKTLTPEQVYVGNLNNPRELVRWVFSSGDPNEVSSVFSVNDQYVIVLVHKVREEGTAEVEEVRDEVRPIVLGQKKADFIIEKLKDLPGDINKKGEAYGAGASTGIARDVKLGTGSIQGIGYEPEIAGTIFGLVPGKRTVPIKGDNGVAVLELIKITEAPEVADYSAQRNTLKNNRQNFIQGDIDEAIKEDADIEDNRVKYF
jgi:peptidyl-prolyl cis-trans isomerase D